MMKEIVVILALVAIGNCNLQMYPPYKNAFPDYGEDFGCTKTCMDELLWWFPEEDPVDEDALVKFQESCMVVCYNAPYTRTECDLGCADDIYAQESREAMQECQRPCFIAYMAEMERNNKILDEIIDKKKCMNGCDGDEACLESCAPEDEDEDEDYI